MAPSFLPPPPYASCEDENSDDACSTNSINDDIYIAVMGVTGSGKSKFIAACSGMDVKVGHSLESCTTEVDDYSFPYQGRLIHLIDTPGFDDTHKSDREVLEGIASWMGNAYAQNQKLSGILYLHRIIDPKLGGSSLRNLVMFKKLCGDDFYPRVFLVTTMWDQVAVAKGKAREDELIANSNFWGKMIEGGARVKRHTGSRDSAMAILHDVVGNRKVDAPTALMVQREMVDKHMNLDETAAGRHFEAELIRQREKHEREMKQLQDDVKLLIEMNEIKAAKDLEKEKRMWEAKIAQSLEDQANLKMSLQDIMQRQAEELSKMHDQLERNRSIYEERVQNLERAQSHLGHMDPASPSTQAFAAQVEQERAAVDSMRQNLEAEKQGFRKKAKRVLIKGKDWVKGHPNAIKMGVSVVSFVGLAFKVANMFGDFGLPTSSDDPTDGIFSSTANDITGDFDSSSLNLDAGDSSQPEATDSLSDFPSSDPTDGCSGSVIDPSPVDTSSYTPADNTGNMSSYADTSTGAAPPYDPNDNTANLSYPDTNTSTFNLAPTSPGDFYSPYTGQPINDSATFWGTDTTASVPGVDYTAPEFPSVPESAPTNDLAPPWGTENTSTAPGVGISNPGLTSTSGVDNDSFNDALAGSQALEANEAAQTSVATAISGLAV